MKLKFTSCIYLFFITSKCVKFNFDSLRFNLFSSMLFLFDYVQMRNVSF